MALCARLCTRNIIGLSGIRCISVTQCNRKVVLKPQNFQPPAVESHDEKNMRLCRPQSPHLTIYKFQLTSMLSITHRFTGIALSGYIAGIGITSLIINQPMAQFITSISTSYPTFFVLLKLGLVFPFTYHFFNGIRHLVWDTGHALSLKAVYITGYITLLVAILTAGGLYYYQEVQKQKKREEERLAAEELKSKGKKKKK